MVRGPTPAFADVGCGFGGLLIALAPLFPETLMLGARFCFLFSLVIKGTLCIEADGCDRFLGRTRDPSAGLSICRGSYRRPPRYTFSNRKRTNRATTFGRSILITRVSVPACIHDHRSFDFQDTGSRALPKHFHRPRKRDEIPPELLPQIVPTSPFLPLPRPALQSPETQSPDHLAHAARGVRVRVGSGRYSVYDHGCEGPA